MRMEFITTNLTGMVRNEKLEGRDYLVVPMVMMVEGVLNGSNGPLYYPAEELAKVPQVWNMKPVVVYHPQMNGKSLSACDPDVINTHKVGLIMNTTFDGKRLKAEAWLEPSRMDVVDNRVAEAITNKAMMEVSTGLFTENEDAEGEFNGKPYTAIARNYRPDHLAILPDQKGACSIEDGAGLLRTNAQGRDRNEILDILGLSLNKDLSHDEIRSALYDAIDPTRKMDGLWIDDVYDTWFIFHKAAKLFKQDYKIKDEKAVLEGMPVEVEKHIVYKDLNGTLIGNSTKGDMKMNKKELVDKLISNTITAWKEEDRTSLEAMDEGVLAKMVPVENADPAPKPATKKDEEEAEPKKTPATNAAVTPEQYLSNAPAGVREVLQDAMVTHSAKKAQLIATITANKKNKFTQDQLSAMSANELEAIAALAAGEEADPAPRPMNFGGMAPVGNAAGAGEPEEPLEAPVMNFKKEAE